MSGRPGAVRDLALSLARSLHSAVRAAWASVSVVATVGFVLAGGAVAGFVALAEGVLEGETRRLDGWILRWLEAARMDWLDTVALEITALGNVATLAVVALAAGAVLWAAERRVSFGLLLASLVTGTGLNHLLKVLFDRPRPSVVTTLSDTASASFPSGHAMLAAVTYGAVAFLVGRMARGRIRWVTWIGAAVLVVLIGLSRMYVGVHFPSDVIAGWLAGIAWTALLVALFRILGVFSREMPELEEAEAELDRGRPRS